MTFGQRLKEERKRLGLTQPDFAQIGKVEKNTQINYEQDKRSPSAEYLLAISEIGVDVHYVLFGTPSSDDLSDDEKELLVGYRALDVRAKARVLGVIEGASSSAAPPTPSKAAPTVTFHGSVGQQIHGDVHGNVQGPDMRKKISKKS